MKNTIIAIVIIILVGVGGYFAYQKCCTLAPAAPSTDTYTEPVTGNMGQNNASTTASTNDKEQVIGTSVEGRPITAYHYGTGDTDILFIGGIHGGYEWNTSLVAYELMDYLESSTTTIPSNVKVTVIPVLNPDGLNKIVGTTAKFSKSAVPTGKDATVPGRFNGNNVDLNRNFDCDWQSEGKWQNKTVSGGSAAFSEPESQAIRNYVESNKPEAVVVWYSAAGGVFSSNCHNGEVLPETTTLTSTYAKASGYPAYKDFNFYEITGDMVNWLAKMEIPAISVLLTSHDDTEWMKNKAGIDAVLKYYAK